MTSGRSLLRLAPDAPDDETLVVSKKKLDQLVRENQRLKERDRQQQREIEERRRKLRVHENPNVPPSVRNHAPGCKWARRTPRKWDARFPHRSEMSSALKSGGVRWTG
jgi:hypothetical protein